MIRSCMTPLLCAVLCAGCPPAGSGVPEVIDVRHVSSAGGAPEIERVVDIGTGAVPRSGPIKKTSSEGSAVIGELVIIWGSGLGKQPTVNIGGRPTEVLAHVRGGGVVVRVPWGIDSGTVKVEVSNREGAGLVTYAVRRLGLVLTGRGVQPLEVGADGSAKTVGGPLPIPGARRMAFSHDGSVVYVGGVAGGKVKLWIVDLTGPVPTVVDERSFPGKRLVDLETAAQGSLGLVVTDSHLVYFDSRTMLNPAFYTPHALPDALAKKGVLAAAVGGRGRRIALLLDDLNQVAVLDASRPEQLPAAIVVDALPDARLQVVGDLRFSPDGSSIWVVSSDTSCSIAGGYQPARLSLLQLADTDGKLQASVHQTWELGGEQFAAPTLALARGEPIPPGTSIRPEPSSSALYIPTYPSDLLKEGFAALLDKKELLAGRVVRSSLTDRAAQEVASGAWLPVAVDVVGQTEVLLALGVALKQGKPVRVLVHGRAWRGGAASVTELGAVPVDDLKARVPWIGTVRAQP